jgi:hypothetical protein
MDTPKKLEDFKYISEFSVKIKPLVSEEADKYLALASLLEIGKYVPKIDTATNVDLLPFACDAFVANRVNKNDDVSDGPTSVAIAKAFPYKPVNIEHNRQKVIGVILNYAFTKFGSNESMSEKEAIASTEPFNVTLGGILWRVVSPGATQAIEEASDPASETYATISASWEVGFMDYTIAQIAGKSKNLADAKIISDAEEIKKISPSLKAFGGKGKVGEARIYRQINLGSLPLGIGLTEMPAADVQGIATDKTKEITKKAKAEVEPATTATAIEQIQPPADQKNVETISQTTKNVVIEERIAIATNMSLKITKIEDITDDALKQIAASEITNFVKEQLKQANEAFVTEKSKLETQAQTSKEAHDKLATQQTQLQDELTKVKAALETLNKEKEARAKQDAFSARMGELDKDFTLTDADREAITAEIADLDETAYAAKKKRLEVLLASKKKAAVTATAAAVTPAPVVTPAAVVPQVATASVKDEQKAVVETALDNASKTQTQLPNTATAVETSLADKYKGAFGFDGWISDVKLAE